jgi:hypothetical protein
VAEAVHHPLCRRDSVDALHRSVASLGDQISSSAIANAIDSLIIRAYG